VGAYAEAHELSGKDDPARGAALQRPPSVGPERERRRPRAQSEPSLTARPELHTNAARDPRVRQTSEIPEVSLHLTLPLSAPQQGSLAHLHGGALCVEMAWCDVLAGRPEHLPHAGGHAAVPGLAAGSAPVGHRNSSGLATTARPAPAELAGS